MHSGRLEINPQFVLLPDKSRVKQVEGLFTDDGVFLEEAVVAFAAAHLEDQLADVEQVVSADVQLRRSTTRHTFRFPTFWIPQGLQGPGQGLTARQSRAMHRSSRAEFWSTRRNSVLSMADLLLQLRPSRSALAKAWWRPSHRSHRRSTEPLELPGVASRSERALEEEGDRMRVRSRAT